ncbi:MAG TPA: FadR/GntR family transcriptional regulator [Solirubrobacteraceae bacterium]|nr:FadR/GntR family transcriptional regulator [Solirubrobacteraceae bacterium]
MADKVPAGSHVEETNFDRVRRVRSFDDVVRQLREAIYSGRIRPGQRLPGERQLCEEFGVGRPTLREALRSLEAVGIIEVRPGKGGGSYAVTPSESTVGDALAALVNLRGASLEDLAEFRVDFEAENASWAARRADAGDIAMLRSIVAEARAAADDPSTLREVAAIDVRWHEALARATKNRLRIGIALGIHEAVLRRHRAAVQPPDADEHSLAIPDDIEAITRAVATGDADSARRLMRAHIGTWNRRATGDATVVADDALSA